MKKLIVSAAAIILSAGLASSAFATQQDGGFYVGVKGGYNKMSMPDGNFTIAGTPVKGNPNNYTANLHVGYLFPVADQFQLGGQIGYSYYGNWKMTQSGSSENIKNKYYSLNAQVVGQWNIDDWFVQGRVGAGRFHASITDSDSTNDSSSFNQWKALAGLSGGYYFTENLSAELFYDHVFGKNLKSNAGFTSTSAAKQIPAMNSVGIGVTYSF